ncbi:hypothetical protein MN202_00965 [Rheinheimera muenzenbergensis]|uniref:Uncharacterized protein n=1 Tax=Rheinheimera muenzenbergensis TaxID=1193628 RepID=A0ABU8C1K1_9GAMM
MISNAFPSQRLTQYFIEHDGSIGLPYLYGVLEITEKRSCLVKVGPVLQLDRLSARALTPYGVYELGALITAPADKFMCQRIFFSKNKNIFQEPCVSAPLSMMVH